jgi:hypothetical protein
MFNYTNMTYSAVAPTFVTFWRPGYPFLVVPLSDACFKQKSANNKMTDIRLETFTILPQSVFT